MRVCVLFLVFPEACQRQSNTHIVFLGPGGLSECVNYLITLQNFELFGPLQFLGNIKPATPHSGENTHGISSNKDVQAMVYIPDSQ